MERKLTAKQEAFAQALANGQTASDAYRAAYQTKTATVKTISEMASRLSKDRNVTARIAVLKAPAQLVIAERIQVDLTRVMFEWCRVGLSDARRLFDADTGELKEPAQWDDDTAAAVSRIKVRKLFGDGKDGKGEIGTVTEVAFWPKTAALDSLTKIFGGYEKDNKQKADVLSDVQRDMLRDMEERIRELVQRQPRLAGGTDAGGA